MYFVSPCPGCWAAGRTGQGTLTLEAPPLPPCAPAAERFTSRAPPATGTRVLLLHLPGPPHLVGSPAGASTCRGGQLGANALLFLSVNTYGVFVRVLAERSQSKAFLQARSYTEDRLRLEDENEKQEWLLMSLLPRYVAMEMKEDFLKPPKGFSTRFTSSSMTM
ncbi:adenylate cyclase type 2-like [Canis lupus familiaris]|uniref:adenylate cyclase type 2-like n=1 Tax=Canis lupus familiaris TaxID=9615 RepID=UPI000DC6D079|nr:adenylate cyclase type 2-like [Canis lupus familiaris]